MRYGRDRDPVALDNGSGSRHEVRSYRSLPTLQHIALVYQDQMRVEHYRRRAEGWMLVVLTRPSDRLSFDAVDVTVDLDTIYQDIPVLRPVEIAGMVKDEPPILIE